MITILIDNTPIDIDCGAFHCKNCHLRSKTDLCAASKVQPAFLRRVWPKHTNENFMFQRRKDCIEAEKAYNNVKKEKEENC